jgi:DNA-binding XRE family transcriptional regulator
MNLNAVSKTWYVYTYSYPDGQVFYVGKGTGQRLFSHEREARSGCSCAKCQTVREIWESGNPIKKDIVVETFDEAEALRAESNLIVLHNSPVLTNLMLRKQPAIKEEAECDLKAFRRLRCMAGLTVQALASEAGVSLSTVNRMEYGTAQVTRRIAYQVLNVISSKIGRRITIEEVEGLQVKS